MKAVRCKRTKNEVKREHYLQKIPESEGGGERPMIRIKKVQHIECEVETSSAPSKKSKKVPMKAGDYKTKNNRDVGEQDRALPSGYKELKAIARGIVEEWSQTKGFTIGWSLLFVLITFLVIVSREN